MEKKQVTYKVIMKSISLNDPRLTEHLKEPIKEVAKHIGVQLDRELLRNFKVKTVR